MKYPFLNREGTMAKSFTDKFRDFVKASATESNKPMTRGEIATAVARKKRKAATKKRASKKATKAAPKKAAKKSKRSKRRSS
jgi:hypothetical protein